MTVSTYAIDVPAQSSCLTANPNFCVKALTLFRVQNCTLSRSEAGTVPPERLQ